MYYFKSSIKARLTASILSIFVFLSVFGGFFGSVRQVKALSLGYDFNIHVDLLVRENGKDQPYNYKRDEVSQVLMQSANGVNAQAYLSTGSVDSNLALSAVPLEEVFESTDTEAIKEINKNVRAELGSTQPERNEILFRTSDAMVSTSLMVGLENKKLIAWGYADYGASEEPLSDGSIHIPADNVGIDLHLVLVFADAANAEVDRNPVEVKGEGAANQAASAPKANTAVVAENTVELDKILNSTQVSFENLSTLSAELENLIPGLPSRNGYKATVKVRQIEKVVAGLEGQASTSAEKELLEQAKKLVSRANTRLKVMTLVNLPAAGESAAPFFIVIGLLVLAVILLIVRVTSNRRKK